MNTRGDTVPPVYHGYSPSDRREMYKSGSLRAPFFVGLDDKMNMKNGEIEEPRKGRRFREKEDGEMIRKYFAKMPTKELARMMGLEPRKVLDFAHRNNFEGCLKKNKAERKQVARENGKKGGRPRKKS